MKRRDFSRVLAGLTTGAALSPVEAAEGADGWNRWGCGAEVFAREAGEVRSLVERLGRGADEFTPSWGGLVLLGETEGQAEAKRARLDPGSNVLVGGPGNDALNAKNYAEAVKQYDVGLAADPEQAALLTNKAAALKGMGVEKYNAAIQTKDKDYDQGWGASNSEA